MHVIGVGCVFPVGWGDTYWEISKSNRRLVAYKRGVSIFGKSISVCKRRRVPLHPVMDFHSPVIHIRPFTQSSHVAGRDVAIATTIWTRVK